MNPVKCDICAAVPEENGRATVAVGGPLAQFVLAPENGATDEIIIARCIHLSPGPARGFPNLLGRVTDVGIRLFRDNEEVRCGVVDIYAAAIAAERTGTSRVGDATPNPADGRPIRC